MSSTKCPECGFENRPAASFCGQCGIGLTQLSSSSSIDASPPLEEKKSEVSPTADDKSSLPQSTTVSDSVQAAGTNRESAWPNEAPGMSVNPVPRVGDYWSVFYWISGIAGLVIGAYTVFQATLIGLAAPSVLLSIDAIGIMIFAATQIFVGLLRQTYWAFRSLTERIIAFTFVLWGILGILLGLFALGFTTDHSTAISVAIYFSTSWNILDCVGFGSIVLMYGYWNQHAPFGISTKSSRRTSQWGRPTSYYSPFHETVSHYPGAYCIRCGMALKRDDRFCCYCGSLKEI